MFAHQALQGALPARDMPGCCGLGPLETTAARARRWADLSEQAKDLLLKMLEYDPATRITGKQARVLHSRQLRPCEAHHQQAGARPALQSALRSGTWQDVGSEATCA